MNQLTLCGELASRPVLSHTNHDREFSEFMLSVERLSGTCDNIRVLAPAALCVGLDLRDTITLTGELRSYNDREAVHNRLKISAWAHTLTRCDAPHANAVQLVGSLCRPAVYRRTPFGREIADLMLCVPREYGTVGVRRCDYIPCIAWGSVARMCAALPPHSLLSLDGRIQSRNYVKVFDTGSEERTAYEVSIATAHVVEG